MISETEVTAFAQSAQVAWLIMVGRELYGGCIMWVCTSQGHCDRNVMGLVPFETFW